MSIDDDVRAILRQVAEAYADALTEAATTVREQRHLTFTADNVADILTGIAAVGMASAEEHFGSQP